MIKRIRFLIKLVDCCRQWRCHLGISLHWKRSFQSHNLKILLIHLWGNSIANSKEIKNSHNDLLQLHIIAVVIRILMLSLVLLLERISCKATEMGTYLLDLQENLLNHLRLQFLNQEMSHQRHKDKGYTQLTMLLSFLDVNNLMYQLPTIKINHHNHLVFLIPQRSLTIIKMWIPLLWFLRALKHLVIREDQCFRETQLKQ